MTDFAFSPLSSASARVREPVAARLVRWVTSQVYGRPDLRGQRSRARVGLVMLVFSLVFLIIAGRLVWLAVVPDLDSMRRGSAQDAVATARPDIVDRHGNILAMDYRTASLFAEPRKIIDVDEAVEQLTSVLPDLEAREVRDRLSSGKGFAWLKREISGRQQKAIHDLGLPGVGFLRENKRLYPNGPDVSQIIGLVNIDNQGISGLEKWVDGNGLSDLHRAGFAADRQQEPIQLSLDLRVQHVLRDELLAAKEKYKAKGAAAVLTDVRTGEILSMVSVPDYDPNDPKEAQDETRINRLTTGVYEMGSTFKAMTIAMGLDSGKISLTSMFDARQPLKYGRFSIDDFHPQRRIMDVSDIFVHSSNIGTARIALAMGVDHHKAFLNRLGQLDRLRTELPESAAPIVPKRWGELNTVTIAFGHGLSVAPLQAVMATAALVNGGYLIPPTFLQRTQEEARGIATKVIQSATSDKMRYLMRINAERGSAKKADVAGYYVGGKTGTSEKVIGGRYSKNKVLTSFMAVFPSDKPQYLLLVMLDEPQGIAETQGFATSGWNSAPAAGKIIARAAPMLGVIPRMDLPPADKLILPRVGR